MISRDAAGAANYYFAALLQALAARDRWRGKWEIIFRA
jgi:hypothetical protein